MLEKAILIAIKAHYGQLDKGGQPYILHPLRVMQSCNSDLEKICAVLHDVIEDTNISLNELREEGFSEEVLVILDLLTKKEQEDYSTFIDRISKNETACRVKIADLQDNMNLSRIKSPSIEDKKRVEKYMDAFERLHGVLYPEKDNIEDYYEIEINGCVTLPKIVTEDQFYEKFIGFIETNHWYFGGGINIVEEDE
ncbi:GTP pyrophosphokinase [Fusibacter sp. JL216-2]|uniref:GTP pyrophosphokinase n=1 Tax=Fusibacter sp. JL216-2 TaxID=3071453 RepID=UPI003D32746A